MSEKSDNSQAAQPKPRGGSARDDRLKAALKANMARRKAQARARNGQAAAVDSDESAPDNNKNE